jgi:hypothetical protein
MEKPQSQSQPTCYDISDIVNSIEPLNLANWLNIQTNAGRSEFSKRLSSWETDLTKLQSRSAQIARLQHNVPPTTRNTFAIIANLEKDLDRIIDTTGSDLESASYAELLFTSPHLSPLNFIPFFLTAFSFIRIWLLPLSALLMPLFLIIAPYFILHYIFHVPIPIDRYGELLIHIILGQPLASIQSSSLSLISLIKENLFQFLIKIASLGMTVIQSVIQPYWSFQHLCAVDCALKKDENILNIFVDKYTELQSILKLPRLTIPINLKGRQLLAWARLNPLSIRQALQNIGRIECQIAVATHSNIVPVIWINNEHPRICLQNCIDYNLVPSLTVPFSYDSATQSHALLTGPNRGGKSTVLRGIGASLILAHTYGAAIATYAAITPFHRLHMCLKPDDLPGKASRFEREVQFAAKTLAQPTLKPVAVLVDELFHSTNPPDAAASSDYYLNKLWLNSSILSIISTHIFTVIDKAPKNIRRICCPATYDSKNKIKFHYQLCEGVCKVSSVQELLRQNGLY